MDIEYCKCEEVKSVTTEFDDFGNEWDVCMECEKPIEDSYVQNPEFDDFDPE